MMSTKSKRELLTTVSPRYVTASGADKQRILDEFVATTGYHRKYATVPKDLHARCPAYARPALADHRSDVQ
jgi:hypothetical protein